ncbi:MAG: flagellar biosynthetic protein FliQ [Candidatus Eremiobacteraeota bacterium]|nr:flagellar biosynthetic protein FliQ [Candidatus Eremiobacteraeota bacterium]
METFDGLLRHALVTTAILCVPLLGVTGGIGLAVALAQAVTQVQEQTLSLLPKLLAAGFIVATFGAFGMQLCAELFEDALRNIPGLVGG